EDNIEAGLRTTLTPGVRFDHNSEFGNNWSPCLNASYVATDSLRLKPGIARAYKAPTLHQANPNYLLYSRGDVCLQSQKHSRGPRFLAPERRHRAGLQGSQPVPVEPQLPAVQSRQRLPAIADQLGRLLPGGQRRPVA